MGNWLVSNYKKGDVIFEEGSIDHALYEMEYGKVGIVKGYGTGSASELATITEGYFGENGLEVGAARNATAVALADTGVIRLEAEDIKDYFAEHPIKLEVLLQEVSERIRATDREFITACEYADQFMAAEAEGKKQDPELIEKMKKLVSGK